MAVIEQLKQLTDEQFLSIYDSLSEAGFGPLDRQVAQALKFRPQAIRKLPMDKRARQAKRILENGANAELTYELIGNYLMRHHKELIIGFLDATGVAHEEGMLDGDDAPAADKLEQAVTDLDGAHEPSDVTLYLSMCVEQWPGEERLESLWRERSGVGV